MRIKPGWRKTAKRTGSAIAWTQPPPDFSVVEISELCIALTSVSVEFLLPAANFKDFFFFFDVDHCKVFSEFVTILLLFYVLDFWLQGMRDRSSLTRD